MGLYIIIAALLGAIFGILVAIAWFIRRNNQDQDIIDRLARGEITIEQAKSERKRTW